MHKTLEEAVAELVSEIIADPRRTVDVLVAAVLASHSLSRGESVECVRARLDAAISGIKPAE